MNKNYFYVSTYAVAVALGRVVLCALGSQCIHHRDVCALVALLFTLDLFRVLLWWSRCELWEVNLSLCYFTFVSVLVWLFV